ncbi:MAG: hypothetical protein WAR37_03370 [Candidatus Microsaccharimonas sp.]
MAFTIPKTPLFYRFLDYLLIPVMFILGGFKMASLQETHPWHSWRIFSVEDVDKSKAVVTKGTDSKSYSKHFLFLFHAPLFGGWKNYSVYTPMQSIQHFHIGWIVYKQGVVIEKGIHKLLIKNGAIRTLDGPLSYETVFFAINENGKQIALRKKDSGQLGDGRFSEFRLF